MLRRIVIVVCLLGGVAAARPPSRAKARRAAKAWITAARKGRVPKGSSPDIEVATSTGKDCDGTWHRDELAAAVRCIAQALAQADRPHDWGTFQVNGDTVTIHASANSDYCLFSMRVTVDATGHVVGVQVDLEGCEF